MDSLEFEVNSVEALLPVAKAIIANLNEYPTVVFEGTLGAGKTALIGVICAELGALQSVSSPTYSLINEYEISGGKLIRHADLYRLESLEEALDTGILDYIDDANFCFIEWPEIIHPVLPANTAKVLIEYNGLNSSRKIVFLLEAFKKTN